MKIRYKRTKLWFICLLTLMIAGAGYKPALAEEISFSTSIRAQLTDWVRDITIPQFDPALGKLTEVQATVSGGLEGNVQFESLERNPVVLQIGMEADIFLYDINQQPFAVAKPTQLITQSVTSFDEFLDFGGTSGGRIDNLVAADISKLSIITNTNDLQDYIGTGEVSLGLSGQGRSFIEGSGNIAGVFSLDALAAITLTYIYEGAGISIDKHTNGEDADTPTGPMIDVGAPVSWEYIIQNTGALAIIDVAVTDDRGEAVSCPRSTLAVGETMICMASGTAVAGQYTNLGTVSGQPVTDAGVPAGDRISDSDRSHYFGTVVPGTIGDYVWLDLNQDGVQDANESPIPGVTIHLLNELGEIVATDVTDENGRYLFENVAPGFYNVEVVPNTLPANAVPTFDKDGIDTLHETVVLVESGGTYLDADFGYGIAAIDIETHTNGADADTPTGPELTIGEELRWEYIVSNSGNVTLTEITVTDNQNGLITCPLTRLGPGETMICTANGSVTEGQYANVGSATGQPVTPTNIPVGELVADVDPSHYIAAVVPGKIGDVVWLDRNQDGIQDADEPPMPDVTIHLINEQGDIVASDTTDADGLYLFESVPPGIYSVEVVQSTLPTDNPIPTFDADGIDSPHSATVIVEPDSTNLEVDFGYGIPAISIETHTNGEDADTPTGPGILVGDEVMWEYIVQNNGTVTLTNIIVLDNQTVSVACPSTTLAAGETMICTANGSSQQGQYANIGSATGQPITPAGMLIGNPATDTDPSHYIGYALPSIDIETHTNGQDADDPTGPEIYLTEEPTVTWEYIVTNESPYTIVDIVVTDNQGVDVTCPSQALDVGESMICTANGATRDGQYANIGSVIGRAMDIPGLDTSLTVTDTDPSHYVGNDAVCLDDPLPEVEFLGGIEQQNDPAKTFILPDGYQTFVVKRVAPFRFEKNQGYVNDEGKNAITVSRHHERVWACSGDCNFTQALEGSIEIGQLQQSSVIHALIIDDDPDERSIWWAADNPQDQTQLINTDGMMTIYTDYQTPFDAKWYLTSEDSIGVVKICITESPALGIDAAELFSMSYAFLPVTSNQ